MVYRISQTASSYQRCNTLNRPDLTFFLNPIIGFIHQSNTGGDGASGGKESLMEDKGHGCAQSMHTDDSLPQAAF